MHTILTSRYDHSAATTGVPSGRGVSVFQSRYAVCRRRCAQVATGVEPVSGGSIATYQTPMYRHLAHHHLLHWYRPSQACQASWRSLHEAVETSQEKTESFQEVRLTVFIMNLAILCKFCTLRVHLFQRRNTSSATTGVIGL